jgi:hypothetical protein
MSGSQIIPTNTFASQSGSIPLSQFDTNFTQLASFLNNPANYANYLADSGTANTYVVTFPTGTVPASYTAGLYVFMKVNNANTTSSTLNVNSLGAKNILNPNLTALSANALLANAIVLLVYDGTQFILQSTTSLNNPVVTNYVETLYAIGNSSTAVTIALTNGTVQTVTMTGNCTFTMPTATAGKSFVLIVSTGAGSFTGTFTSVKWPNNAAPTLTTTASRWDILTFFADGTNWYGTYAQAFQ